MAKPKDTRPRLITHDGETRTNIPTAELENLKSDEEAKPQKVEFPRKMILTKHQNFMPAMVI